MPLPAGTRLLVRSPEEDLYHERVILAFIKDSSYMVATADSDVEPQDMRPSP